MSEDKTYTYNWIWFILMTLCAVIEVYWVGLGLERKYTASVILPMALFFCMGASGFLLAFSNSKKEKVK